MVAWLSLLIASKSLIEFDEYGKAVMENLSAAITLVYGTLYLFYFKDKFFYEDLLEKIKNQEHPTFVESHDTWYVEVLTDDNFIDLSR